MNIASANPDIETLRLTLWIGASVLALLLSVVAYFLKKQIGVQETLIKAVNNLSTTVEIIQDRQADRDPRTERRLNEHSIRLDEHQNRLSIVETRCMMTHKNDAKNQ